MFAMNRQSGALIGLAAAVSFLLGLVIATTRTTPVSNFPAPPGTTEPLALRTAPPAPAGRTSGASVPVDFSSVAAGVNVAVVNVDTASRGADEPVRSGRRRYSTDDEDAPHEGSGSGFVIDPSGFILTNYHVVSGADRVTVTLNDGRALRAEVIGVDPALDVALLRVRTPDPLRTVVLGDSDSLRVGEWVCAIGNPLGVYVHSVTVGVVSFLGRKLFNDNLDAYIQTDAAISVGNSGGPLINARGEVVGITTAVSTQAPNIGFAIPIGQVMDILPQLRERGIVARGDLGAGLTNLTPGLRHALDLEPERGALVQDVVPDLPADRAGLRAYDVIVGVDGRPVESDEFLSRYVASRLPGTVTTLDVWRNGKERRVSVKLAMLEVFEPARRRTPRAADAKQASQSAPLGIEVRALDEALARSLHIPRTIQGVLVREVDPAGPARLAQVRLNQVILEINRRPVRSVAEYRAAEASLKPGETVALLVYDKFSQQRQIYSFSLDSEP